MRTAIEPKLVVSAPDIDFGATVSTITVAFTKQPRLILLRLLFRQNRLSGKFRRTLQRCESGCVPCALKIRVTVCGPRWGPPFCGLAEQHRRNQEHPKA